MKEYEVRTMIAAKSPEDAANRLYGSGLSALFITDPDDQLKQESRFKWTSTGYKFVDAKVGADFDPAKAAEQHAKNLFHTLWGRAKACDSEEAPYDKAEWMQLQMTLHDLGVDV